MDIISSSALLYLLDLQAHGLSIYDCFGQCVYSNNHAHVPQNLTKSAFESTPIFTLFPQQTDLKLQFNQLLKGDLESVQFEVNRDNRFFQISLVADGNTHVIAAVIDKTEQHTLKWKLKQSQQNVTGLDDALNAANIGCWDFFPKEGKIVATKIWSSQKKYEDSELRKDNALFSEVVDGFKTWSDLVHPDDLALTLERIQQHLDGKTDVYDAKFRMKCGDDEWRWIHDRGRIFERDEDGSPTRMKGAHMDITESKQSESRILELLNIDFLTKVNSRRSFEEHVNQILKQCNRDKSYLAFLLLDIDYFKLFNDTYGHLEGDHSLTAIGDAINKSLKREGDTCFRLGGEEFAIIYQVDSKQTALKLAHTIKDKIESLKIPHKYNTASPYLTVSMGLWCDKTNENIVIDDIYSRADTLLYQAKSSGRNMIKF